MNTMSLLQQAIHLTRWIGLLATLSGLALPIPAFADSVSTSVSNGFARILFTLDPAAQGATELTGGVLTIHFDRKIEVVPDAISAGLAAYVTSVRADTDGQTFRLALAQAVSPHSSISGVHFALDLVPPTFSGTPPDLPSPPSAKSVAVDPATLPPLLVRAGIYATYSRLVFDWPNSVRYTIFPTPTHLTIKFTALVRPDFSTVNRISPPWVKPAGWRIEGNATVLEFDLDSGSRHRAFRDGPKIVLDVLAPQTDAAAPAQHPDIEPDRNSNSTATATKLNGAQKQAITQSANVLGDSKKAAAPAPTSTKSDTGTPAEPSVDKTAFTSALATTAKPSTLIANPTISKIAANRTRDGVTLVFPHAAAVAAFVRGMTAWIVVEGNVPLDPAMLKSQLGEFPESLESTSGGDTVVLRIGLKSPERIAALMQGSDLLVNLSSHAVAPSKPITLTRSDDDVTHAALAALVPGASHALTLTDPAAGDTLIVVPAAAGQNIPAQRSYLEFAALPTAAGLVIRPLTDDLNVIVADSRVSITRAGGLVLTPSTTPIQDLPTNLILSGGGPTFLDFQHWSTPDEPFLNMEQSLIAAAASGSTAAQLALARFYLSNKFAAEALGTLKLVQARDPAFEGDRRFQIMRGAAEYMMGRYSDAQTDLAGIVLQDDPHAALWRELTEAALENWPEARRSFERAELVLHLYAPEWQLRARIAASDAMLETGATDLANRMLANLPKDLPKDLLLGAQLVRAKLLAHSGNAAGASALFHAVEDGGNENLAAHAIYSRIEANLDAHRISVGDAISGLERLRFRWRGDMLELKTLRKLGSLYFAQQDWRGGLQTLRVASEEFPNNEVGRQAQDDMRTAFESLFLKGEADHLPPVDALALFYDFVDLTPIGPNGDEMIRRMADRLVAVDLPGPAATLLKYQVSKRLDGAAQAQVATRLAMLDLLNHQPKDALEVLRSTRISGLPDNVNHERLLLEARALAALQQWDQAIDLIAVDNAEDTKALRADIYWESGAWELAGQKSEELLPILTGTEPFVLSKEGQRQLMRAAVAYSLAGDQAALDRLRSHFGVHGLAGPDSSAFAMMTQKLDTQDAAFRDTAARIASVDTLERFMKDFQRHYAN